MLKVHVTIVKFVGAVWKQKELSHGSSWRTWIQLVSVSCQDALETFWHKLFS